MKRRNSSEVIFEQIFLPLFFLMFVTIKSKLLTHVQHNKIKSSFYLMFITIELNLFAIHLHKISVFEFWVFEFLVFSFWVLSRKNFFEIIGNITSETGRHWSAMEGHSFKIFLFYLNFFSVCGSVVAFKVLNLSNFFCHITTLLLLLYL